MLGGNNMNQSSQSQSNQIQDDSQIQNDLDDDIPF